jgi:hypothetical protein
MKYRKKSKSFTKKKARALLLTTWGRKSHKSNILHELVKKEVL